MSDNNEKSGKAKLGVYVSLRVIIGVVIAVASLWAGSVIIMFFNSSDEVTSPYQQVVENNPTLKKMDGMLDSVIVHEEHAAEVQKEKHVVESDEKQGSVEKGHIVDADAADSHAKESTEKVSEASKDKDANVVKKEDAHTAKNDGAHAVKKEDAHAAKNEGAHGPAAEIKPVQDPEKDFGPQTVEVHEVRGSAFAAALIKPLDFELNERRFGWRPNDIFSFFTDNIENYQRGVLEVTRRASTTLVERIARTGSNIRFDKNLDSARTKFMNDPTKYWMPAPEDAYGDALEEIETYRERLNNGKATFHARADNLVPLLEAFENLLGDCDETLVKRVERNGSQVSTFAADDYYYYSKGVASAMATILHAIMEDFGPVLDSRGAAADLHHAKMMLDAATELDPLFVQESDLNGLFANHRANLATFISHARSYVQFVLRTMTT